ncbi:MAG: PfkB family carbohydrate kinase [Patescibacteria group bacterium]
MNILVTGSISYDEILDFPGKFVNYFQPEKLHQINVSFVVDRLERQLGGTATNIAYNVSLALRLFKPDVNSVKIFASVGKDGKVFIDFLGKSNIDTSGIMADQKLYSAFGSVITDKKDNQIWGFYYGACERAKEIAIKKKIWKKSLMIISANHPKAFMNFQNQAIKNGVEYVYDPGMSLTWIKDRDLAAGVLKSKYLIGNDYEITMILKRIGRTVSDLASKGISVITTLGEKGVVYQDRKHRIEVKAFRKGKVVDPTGAGDAWRGGFMAAITSSSDLKTALKLGNAMASFAIEKYGTVNHNPSVKAIEKRLKSM